MRNNINNETSAKETELIRQIHILKQQIQFKTFQLTDSKDRQANLKRLNQALILALAQQRPNIVNQIRLITKNVGKNSTERQLQLQKQIQKLKINLEKELQQRVKKIIGQRKNIQKCLNCDGIGNRYQKIEQQNKKIRIQLKILQDQNKKLQNQLKTIKQENQKRRIEIQVELKRQKQGDRMRQYKKRENDIQKTQMFNKLDNQWKQKYQLLEISKKFEFEQYAQELQESYQKIYQQKINQVVSQYQAQYQNKYNQLRNQYLLQIQRLTNLPCKCKKQTKYQTQDKKHTKINNRLTNNRFPLQEVIDQQNQPYCPKQFYQKQKKNIEQIPKDNQFMKNQIKNIISGLTKNKQNSTPTSILHTNNTTYLQDDNQYSNFSIKDSLNRPNNLLLESHLRLKRKNHYYD